MKKSVLIIDDSEFVRVYLSQKFKELGWEVISEERGIEGIIRAFRENPQLIILDILLPDINGYLVCRLLKNEPQTMDIPIIFFTVKGSPRDKYWGFESGADYYINKDEGMDKVIKLSEEILKSRGRRSSIIMQGDSGIDSEERLLSKLANMLDEQLYIERMINDIIFLTYEEQPIVECLKKVVDILYQVINFDLCVFTLGIGQEIEHYIFSTYRELDQSHPFLTSFLSLIRNTSIFNPGVNYNIKIYTSEIDDNLARVCQEENVNPDKLYIFYGDIVFPKRGIINNSISFYGEKIKKLTEERKSKFNLLLKTALSMASHKKMLSYLEGIGFIDEETSLFNKNFFIRMVEIEYLKAQRNQELLSLILLDIDKFTSLTQKFGFGAEEYILARVGYLLKKSIRRTDMICRVGKDEFAIIFPGLGIAQAKQIAHRIKTLVEDSHMAYGNKVIRFTLSIGIVEYNVQKENWSLEQLINNLDISLIEAKKRGGNVVISYNEEISNKEEGK